MTTYSSGVDGHGARVGLLVGRVAADKADRESVSSLLPLHDYLGQPGSGSWDYLPRVELEGLEVLAELRHDGHNVTSGDKRGQTGQLTTVELTGRKQDCQEGQKREGWEDGDRKLREIAGRGRGEARSVSPGKATLYN